MKTVLDSGFFRSLVIAVKLWIWGEECHTMVFSGHHARGPVTSPPPTTADVDLALTVEGHCQLLPHKAIIIKLLKLLINKYLRGDIRRLCKYPGPP